MYSYVSEITLGSEFCTFCVRFQQNNLTGNGRVANGTDFVLF